ncbi:MAG: sugar ABC transporter permease, partial [Thermoplasmata archaeon]
MKKLRARTIAAIVFIIPGLAAFLMFNIYPIVYSIFISFTDANLKNFPIGTPSIVGLDNYRRVLFDPAFKRAFIWTWIFVLTSVSLKVLVGLLLSILYTNRYVIGKSLFRALLIIPWALPLLFSVTIWRFMFDPVFGPVNIVLSNYFGVTNPPRWTDQFTWGFIALNVIEVWLAYPFMMTVITSALQSVSEDLIEAAIVDGATYWQRLRHIIIPLV